MVKFSPHLLQQIRDRLPLSQLVAPHARLERRGKDVKACCPFHKEKTPSFHVHDDRQYYHCFGCGAHGDHFSFVMEQEGLSFPETVEKLASIANVSLPKPDAFEQRQQAKRDTGVHILELAANWFQQQLLSPQARQVQDYVLSRGLTEATATQFMLGYAPNDGQALIRFLQSHNISDALMIEHGLAIKPERGDLFCRFRDRLIFPIWDRQGKVIGFGGRAMQDGAKAKYLNSPESPLFHKSSVIYGAHLARQAAHKQHRLLMVEGYMDVIALAQSGIAEAVAPLGTALTEDQLRLAWAMNPEPILCLDGDAAGQRAMERAMERALPLLEPGKSLRFLILPEGEDPDSLIQKEGRTAFEKRLSAAEPLIARLWQWQQHKHVGHTPSQATPEQKAALEDALHGLAGRIEHAGLKRYYEQDIRNRLYQMSRWSASHKKSSTPSFKPSSPKSSREREYWLMLGLLITYPALIEDHQVEEQLASLSLPAHAQQQLQQLLLDYILAAPQESLTDWAHNRQAGGAIAQCLKQPDVQMCSIIQRPEQEPAAKEMLLHLFNQWHQEATKQAKMEAKQRFQQEPSEDQWQALLHQLEDASELEE